MAGVMPQDLPPFSAAFKTELERAGYKVVTPGEDNLFDPQAGLGGLQAAAVITDEHVDGCMSRVGLSPGNRGDVRGEAP